MIVGIDLGTSNSLIAVFEDGRPVPVPNATGGLITPSVVGLDDEGAVLTGTAARDRLVSHPDKTAARFKRSMGTDRVYRLGTRQKFTAEDLSALVLRDLKSAAEVYLKADVTDAVISVPAYFNEHQRQATMRAGALAGLNVRALINEPTAAALAYGLVDIDGSIREEESGFLVFDLGGGTFDVSVLELFEGVLEVRASTGDAFLGGEDFTLALAKDLAARLAKDTPFANLNSKDRALLFTAAERIKHALGTAPDVTLNVGFQDAAHSVTVTRDEFNTLCDPLIKRMRRPLQRAVADAGVSLSDLDRILLVGGATRMQGIRDMVARLFGRFPEFGINPDEVVALGAAVQAALISNNSALADVVMTDVAPYTLGIETSIQIDNRGGQPVYDFDVFSPIIERNTVVPVSREQQYATLQDGQTELKVNVFQGESSHCKDNIRLGSVKARVPKAKAGQESIDVRFTYDPSGLLEVDVTVTSTKQKFSLVIEGHNAKLDRAALAKKLKELEALKVHPRDTAQNKALQARIERMYEMTLGDQRRHISHLSSRFKQIVDGQDPKEIAASVKEISEVLDGIESSFEL